MAGPAILYMELDMPFINLDNLGTLRATLLAALQPQYPVLTLEHIKVDLDSEGRRRQADLARAVIRISISNSANTDFKHHSAANTLVSLFRDGTLYNLMPEFPIAHVQSSAIGEWSCWFNWDSPGTRGEHEDKGSGDYEDVSHILSHYKGDEAHQQICEGGESPTGIHCRTANHVAWNKAGQTLAVPCSIVQGIVCLNADNPSAGCQDYQVQFHCDGKSTFSSLDSCTQPTVAPLPLTREPTPWWQRYAAHMQCCAAHYTCMFNVSCYMHSCNTACAQAHRQIDRYKGTQGIHACTNVRTARRQADMHACTHICMQAWQVGPVASP